MTGIGSAARSRRIWSGPARRAAIGLGPIAVHEIREDETVVWTGPVTRGADDFLDITIEDRGVVGLPWGTETQTQDPDLVASGVLHPACRSTCYAVFLDPFIGKDRASAVLPRTAGRRFSDTTPTQSANVLGNSWPDEASAADIVPAIGTAHGVAVHINPHRFPASPATLVNR